MSEDTISIITYEVKPLTDPSGKPTGSRGDNVTRRFFEEEGTDAIAEEELKPIRWEYLTKHEVPISTIETELQKLVTQMNRILKRLELDAKAADQADESPSATDIKRRFVLNEIALHVEINGEGSLSILGTGGKLGGKGGMQLTFTRP